MSRLLPLLLLCAGILCAKEVYHDNVIPGEVIFKLGPETALLKTRAITTGVSEVDAVLTNYNLRSVEPMFRSVKVRRRGVPDISRIYIARYDSDVSPYVIAKSLEKLSQVIYAEPRFIRRVEETPNDSLFSSQWHLSKIQASAAWDITHGDSTIIVAIVDNGFDMDHPDLEANYFTNPDEIPDNGTDDEGNGYVDDISGWDFAGDNSEEGEQPDNDPSHGPQDTEGYWMHGTGMAGLANAVTDNATGVAGVAWNVQTLAVKTSYNDTPRSVYFGYEGIKYAAEMGADIISCSWGGPGYSQAEVDIIEYATTFGALVIGSAGNDDSDEYHSPSAYEEVVSVASVNDEDVKSSFSNYGLSVDVSAPGENMLTTFPDGEYNRTQGTSPAAPVVAGIAALVKSYYPDLTTKEIAMRVAGTTENIYGVNPNYNRLLGTGRVNALNALSFTESEFVSFPAEIELFNSNITDAVAGDGNGVLDRGETVHISTTYRNYSLGSLDNYTVRLSTDHPDLVVTNDETSSYPFPSDTTDTIENELIFTISNTAAPSLAKLALDVMSGGSLKTTDTLVITIGKMPILVVDDDCCSDTVHVDGFYTGILEENEILYGVWDHSSKGSPSASTLSNFPTIIWFTEWDFPGLDSLDRVALRDFLDNGGNLFLSGQDLGWDLNENPGSEDQTSFFKDYLHASWGGDDAGTDEVEGFFGDLISHGLSFNVYQPGIDNDQQYPDWFTPDDETTLIFQYDNGKGMGLRYDGDYRLVYTGMGLEAFGSDINSVAPDDINNIQRTVLSRTLDYLNFIHHDPLTDTETTTSDFEIEVDVTGDISDLSSVKLYYKTDSMENFTESSLSDEGNGLFSGSIPAPNTATTINYYIETENEYYLWTNPVGTPENSFSFYAGPDVVKPEIPFITELKNRIDRTGSDQVSAYVTDNIGLEDVALEYTVVSGTSIDTNSVPMTFDGELWNGEIEWSDVPGSTVITYQVVATDNSSNQNEGRSDPLSFTIVNWTRITDWEDKDISGWDTGDGWGIAYINNEVGHGVNDSPGSTYDHNANNVLTILNPIDLSPYDKAYLSFWHGAVIQENNDVGYIEISGNNTDWDTVSTITGVGVERDEVIRITSYISNSDLWIRFRLTSDSTTSFIGWLVDDIYLMVDTTVKMATAEELAVLPKEFSLEQNYPNPFNPTTTIRFDLPQAGDVKLVIYNILGREVETLVSTWREAGRHEVVWTVGDQASGVYFYRLTVGQDGPGKPGSYTQTRKMVLLK